MSKVNRGVSKSRPVQRKQNKLPLIMALAGAAILIIAAFFALPKETASFTPEVTGGPSLKVGQGEGRLRRRQIRTDRSGFL